MCEIDDPWSPVDSNGNHLHDIQQQSDVSRLLPDDAEIVGVDSRGLACFGDESESDVYYVRLTVDGDLEHFNQRNMFGGDIQSHVAVVAERFNNWKWLSDTVK